MRIARGFAALAVVSALSAVPSAAGADLLPLHAVRGDDPRIVDSAGRQVLLRGVNEDALGDYDQQYPQYPAVLPLTANDFKEMAGLGFNVVRLIVSWSRLEPTPGAFNLDYVNQIQQAVNWAAADGLYTVLDMHQNAWGIGVAGHAGESCLPGFTAPVGFDGAPEWATYDDNLSTCVAAGKPQLSLADEAAWQNFYNNDQGIQTQLIDTWAQLAEQFAADPDVAGYDLLNEPNPGLTLNESSGSLGDYYTRVLSAIRTAESETPSGLPHIAFFEPGVEWSQLGTAVTPKGGFTSDSDTVFAPHLYAGSLAVPSVAQGFADAESATQAYGTTLWAGEYGWYGDPTADEADIAEFAKDQDAQLWGGAWMEWKQACGSPSSIGTFGGPPPTITTSLVRINCAASLATDSTLPSTQALAIPATTEQIISRATVHAAPGELTSLQSDGLAGSFDVTGDAAVGSGSCQLQVWIPGGGKPRFTETGVSKLVSARVRGGYEVTGCAAGSYELKLAGRNAAGLACPAALRVTRIARAKPGRAARITLTERVRGGSSCTGTLTVKSGRARLATGTFNLAPGRSQRRLVTLSRAGRRLFAGHRKLRISVTLTGSDVDANAFGKALSARLQ